MSVPVALSPARLHAANASHSKRFVWLNVWTKHADKLLLDMDKKGRRGDLFCLEFCPGSLTLSDCPLRLNEWVCPLCPIGQRHDSFARSTTSALPFSQCICAASVCTTLEIPSSDRSGKVREARSHFIPVLVITVSS